MSFINYNGELLPANTPIIAADNRGLRYGDGLFETMRMFNDRIPLWDFHAERFFNGLHKLKFELPDTFTEQFVLEEIKKLCKKNACLKSSRVRLGVYRGSGSLYDHADIQPNFVIQSWEIEPFTKEINSAGLVIDTYPDARKSCDVFANIKSNNFLPYTMAAIFAKENNLHDCLLLNTHERICDSTIANVFVGNNFKFKTPPLSEGCVAGVMRKYILEVLDNSKGSIKEEPINIEDLLEADEVFLTNAVQGIRWVSEFRNKSYRKTFSPLLNFAIHQDLFS